VSIRVGGESSYPPKPPRHSVRIRYGPAAVLARL
jgi:hypothetical protein